MSNQLFSKQEWICESFEKTSCVSSKCDKKRIILIAGPTGVGKTDLSFAIAQCFPRIEIISADSMQVYEGMDIGTAKVSDYEQSQIPHHLINIRHITEPFNVVDFYHESQKCIKQIFARGNVPVVLGGAGFYFQALLYGPPSGPASVPEVRSSLEQESENKGIDFLYDKLEKLDPSYAATITRGDKQKIIRALEIISLTQHPVSKFPWKERCYLEEYDFRAWFVFRQRHILYERIEKRCEKMLKLGLLSEVKRLLEEGLMQNTSACQAIGYKQCIEYLKTEQTEEEYKNFVLSFKQASRNYAKRQFTWFKKEPFFRWLDLDIHDYGSAAEIIVQDYLS